MYSIKFARPKWRLTKLVTISTFLGISSYTLGFKQKLTAHFRFARSLENPTGFNQALRNINARLGGPEHFPYGVPERQEEPMPVALGPGVTALSNDQKPHLETTESGEDWTTPQSTQSQEEPDQNRCKFPYVITALCASFLPQPASTDAMVCHNALRFDSVRLAFHEYIHSHVKFFQRNKPANRAFRDPPANGTRSGPPTINRVCRPHGI